MENKKWTDSELRIAFEDGCKYLGFNDLKSFLLERRIEDNTSESGLHLQNVSKCVFCENPPYKEGASYCEEHMNNDDWS